MSTRIAMKRRVAREKRHQRVRRRISGTAERPRLCVFRSHKHIYAQVIDDRAGETLAAASTLDPELNSDLDGKTKREQARLVGQAVADRATDKGIDSVVFDRGGYDYHGRVRELAEGARAAGLSF